MSDMEYHTGKIRDVTRIDIDLEEQCRLTLADHGQDKIEVFNDNWVEQFNDYMYKKYTYIIINNRMYEFVDHLEFDPDNMSSSQTSVNGEIEFQVSFYNGGGSLNEAIEEAIKNDK